MVTIQPTATIHDHKAEGGQREVQITEGMGCTQGVGSDRYPYRVSAILSAKRVQVRRVAYRRTDQNGFSESQEYEYGESQGEPITITKRPNGRWVRVGESQRGSAFWFSGMRAYQDPHR